VLAHNAGRNHFGADPAVVGRAVFVSNQPFTIVGVLDPQFESSAWFATHT
jgi:hypothetical protein